MNARDSADYDAGHAYTEYGVLVDRTSAGLGVFLAETTRDLERAERLASRSLDAWGYPAEVKVRRVYVTDWSRVLPPADCSDFDCDGNRRQVQGWTDKNGCPEDQYGECSRPCGRVTAPGGAA